MRNWAHYPSSYRHNEIQQILSAVKAGESVSIIGLSGAGKSNLLGFLVHGKQSKINFFFIDGNQLLDANCTNLFSLIKEALYRDESFETALTDFQLINKKIQSLLQSDNRPVCLVIDRFDSLSDEEISRCAANLRALRDRFKYQLSFVFSTRSPIPLDNEISELIFGNTIWLGPLSDDDAAWSIAQFCSRKNLTWHQKEISAIQSMSQNYPSFLRGICEAHAAGCPLNQSELKEHPAVQFRLREFQSDQPDENALRLSRLNEHPFLNQDSLGNFELTEKENLLFNCLKGKLNLLVEKDEIIAAVWPEDKVVTDGIRDDSLAQLIRRLRKKIQSNPDIKQEITTITGRGYKLVEKI